MSLIVCTTGREGQRNSSITVRLTHTAPAFPDEAPLYIRTKSYEDWVRTTSGPHFTAARRNYDQNMGGRWVTTTYDVADYSVMRLAVSKNTHAHGLRTANVFMLPREDGPITEIQIPLLCASDSILQEVRITGQFDVLSFEEGLLRGGRTNQTVEASRRFFDNNVVASLLTITEKEPAQNPLPGIGVERVRDDEGKEVAIPRDVTERKLEL